MQANQANKNDLPDVRDMEKATLLVEQSKKKKIFVKIVRSNGKTQPFSALTFPDTSLNNSAVLVEWDNGQPVRIEQVDGTVLFPRESNTAKKGNTSVRNPAYAPYNFVPLNDKPVLVEKPKEENKYHSRDAKEKADYYTGWIDIDIKTLTPLYIRGTLTEDEVSQGKVSNDKPDFFSPSGRLRIPGSSLRGLIRSMVEMVSYGKFHFADRKRRLYYRGLADRSNLRSEYQRRMSSYDRRNKKTQYKCSAGLLFRSNSEKKERGEHFEIQPSGNFRQIYKNEARQKVKRINKDYAEFNWYKVDESYLVVSGDMANKKRDWLITPPSRSTEFMPILPQDVQSYLDDSTRGKDVPNLIQDTRQRRTGVPCFYVRWQDEAGKERISFGHTGMFRLAYEKTIAEHIPDELLNDKRMDLAEAIFGNETTRSSRVFFEDAFCTQDDERQQTKKYPQILSEPKPTTFQHYLVQDSDEIKQLKHYNSNSTIRGYKAYWHKSGNKWESDEQEKMKDSSQCTEIRPVITDTLFSGKIRFENLTATELGALLFSLDLPKGCGHKLGMGKPLGLGSIRITPKLYLSDRPKRYKSLFTEWASAPAPVPVEETAELKEQFEVFILSKTGKSEGTSLWGTRRLRELLTMLHIDLGNHLEKIDVKRYMAIKPCNEFKSRNVLPTPSKVSATFNIDNVLNEIINEKKRLKKQIKGSEFPASFISGEK